MMYAYIYLVLSLPTEPRSCNILAYILFVYSQPPMNIYIYTHTQKVFGSFATLRCEPFIID